MLPEERDAAYLWDMLQAANEVKTMIGNQSLSNFLDDLILMRALERGIEIIGEAARHISTTYMDTHPEIPWHKIFGQRNILAHEYGQIDYEVLYKTAVDDVPELITLLENLLPPIEAL